MLFRSFTANDCNSISYNLFAELDAGKVVVVAFVMPCSACIGPSLTAYNVATSFASSNPGRVKFFLSDDLANTSCSIVSGWATNNNITPDAVFSSTDFIETQYGAEAMPKVVDLRPVRGWILRRQT